MAEGAWEFLVPDESNCKFRYPVLPNVREELENETCIIERAEDVLPFLFRLRVKIRALPIILVGVWGVDLPSEPSC